MISKDDLVNIIIEKAKYYGVEQGDVQIMPELLEDKKFFFFGLFWKASFLDKPAALAFIGIKETGDVHDIDMEIEWDLFEKQYEKMRFDEEGYKKLCDYLQSENKVSWLFQDEE